MVYYCCVCRSQPYPPHGLLFRCAYYWRPTQAACLLAKGGGSATSFLLSLVAKPVLLVADHLRSLRFKSTSQTYILRYPSFSFAPQHPGRVENNFVVTFASLGTPCTYAAMAHITRPCPKRTHAQIRRSNRRAGTWTAVCVHTNKLPSSAISLICTWRML